MFVSAGYLGINYGVDDKIAKFFVDRVPPENNLYWKDKLMYLRLETGWLFIPLIVDILYKIGIEREQLLSEDFVGLMEGIGHISAEEELELIDGKQAKQKCAQLAKANCKNNRFYDKLAAFVNGDADSPFIRLSTPFKALHRGDAFLFSLSALQFHENLDEKIVKHWFALITTLLLLDDAEDLEIDRTNGDENAFLESGQLTETSESIKDIVKKNLQIISAINKPMALKLDQKFKALLSKPHLQEYINQ